MPALNLYECLARHITRDLNHTLVSRLLKIDALIILNRFNAAITLLQRLQRGERLPQQIHDKFKPVLQTSTTKYVSFN